MSVILTDKSNLVELHINASQFSRGFMRRRSVMETPDLSLFTYDHGGRYYSATLSLDDVSSADASTINDWWTNRTDLQFNEATTIVESYSIVTLNNVMVMSRWIKNLFISNRNKPMSQNREGDISLWRGTIYLESF